MLEYGGVMKISWECFGAFLVLLFYSGEVIATRPGSGVSGGRSKKPKKTVSESLVIRESPHEDEVEVSRRILETLGAEKRFSAFEALLKQKCVHLQHNNVFTHCINRHEAQDGAPKIIGEATKRDGTYTSQACNFQQDLQDAAKEIDPGLVDWEDVRGWAGYCNFCQIAIPLPKSFSDIHYILCPMNDHVRERPELLENLVVALNQLSVLTTFDLSSSQHVLVHILEGSIPLYIPLSSSFLPERDKCLEGMNSDLFECLKSISPDTRYTFAKALTIVPPNLRKIFSGARKEDVQKELIKIFTNIPSRLLIFFRNTFEYTFRKEKGRENQLLFARLCCSPGLYKLFHVAHNRKISLAKKIEYFKNDAKKICSDETFIECISSLFKNFSLASGVSNIMAQMDPRSVDAFKSLDNLNIVWTRELTEFICDFMQYYTPELATFLVQLTTSDSQIVINMLAKENSHLGNELESVSDANQLMEALEIISSDPELCLKISDWCSGNSELSEAQFLQEIESKIGKRLNALTGLFLQILNRVSFELYFLRCKSLMEKFITTLNALPTDLHLHLLPPHLATELHAKLSLAQLELPTIEKANEKAKSVAAKTTRLLDMFSQDLRKILDPIILDVVASAFPSEDPQQVLHSVDLYRFRGEWLPIESPGRWKVLHPDSLCMQFSELHLASMFFQVWNEELKPCLCDKCRNGESSPQEMMFGHYPIALPSIPSNSSPSGLPIQSAASIESALSEEEQINLAIRASAAEFQRPLGGTYPVPIKSNQLLEIIQGRYFCEDTGFLVQDIVPAHELVRVYRNPVDSTYLARIQTGGKNNMCPLLALGELQVDTRDKARVLVLRMIKALRSQAETYLSRNYTGKIQDEQSLRDVLARNPKVVLGELLWTLVSEESLPQMVDTHIDRIFTEDHVDYTCLWNFLLNGHASQIEFDDLVWWNAMAQALDAEIRIYQGLANGGLTEPIVYNAGGSNIVRIFARAGHYTMLMPIDEEVLARIQREITRNAAYSPMF